MLSRHHFALLDKLREIVFHLSGELAIATVLESKWIFITFTNKQAGGQAENTVPLTLGVGSIEE